MSHSTNSNVNFSDVCHLSFETKKSLYRHQPYDSKNKELLEKMSGSDDEAHIDVESKAEKVTPEKMEIVYDTEEEYYFIRPKPQTYSKPRTESESKSESKPERASLLVPQTESIHKDNTKDILKTKPITKPETKTEDGLVAMLRHNTYSRIKYVKNSPNYSLI